MNITLNNSLEHFDKESLSVNELLKLKHFTFKLLVIKINGKVIRKENYDDKLIHDGDKVHVIHLISGG